MPTIGKPRLSFQIFDSKDPKTLILADMSAWNNIKDNPATISIKIPGAENYSNYSWNKNKLNVFNSNTLHLTSVQDCDDQDYADLPDGIYQFILKGTPDDIYCTERFYLKTDQMNIEKSKMYIRAGIDFTPASEEMVKRLRKVEFYKNRAEAFAFTGDFGQAQDNFKRAKKLLTQCQHSNC